MRRVMALIGFSSFFVSLFCLNFNSLFTIILFALSLISLIIFLCVKQLRLTVLILLCASIMISCVNCYITTKNIEKINETYCSAPIEIKGELVDYPEVNKSGFFYTFKTLDENKVKFSIVCNDDLEMQPGDTIKGEFEFNNNYADYSEKIYFSAYTYMGENLEIIHKDENNIAKIRGMLKGKIDDNTTFARGLTKAILFGDKSGLTDEVYVYLQRCGLLHATATSGLHLTIVTGFVFALLSFSGVSKKKSSLFSIVFIILFMIVIGFKFSLMRAGIMMIIYFSANLFDRENDAFNAIGLSIAFLVLQNPYTVTSVSFLLSVSATIGMIIVFNPLYQKIENMKKGRFDYIKRGVISFLASSFQSLVATVFTLPVTYIFFGYFSIAGIFANAVLSIFITAILMFGLLICLLFYIPLLPEILGGALDMICLGMIKIAGKISEFKYALINIDFIYIAILIFLCFIVIAVAVLLYYFTKLDRKRIINISLLVCVNLLLISILLNVIFPSKNIDLIVQNSSGGICITTVVDNEMIALETGGKNGVRKINYQLTNNCLNNVKALFVPTSTDALNSACAITNSFKVENVFVDKSKFDKKYYDLSGKTINISENANVNFDELDVEIIKQEDSDVFYLTNRYVSVLIIDGQTCCEKLPRKFKNCDVVIVNDTAPIDVSELYPEKAIVCTYDKATEQTMANLCPTYSALANPIEISMSKKISITEV